MPAKVKVIIFFILPPGLITDFMSVYYDFFWANYKRKKSWFTYGDWIKPYEPINKEKLGSSQEWGIEKPNKHYY